MTDLYDISQQVAKLVTDVLDGAATTGTTSSLTDTLNLRQQAQYYDNGTLWVHSGNHDRKVFTVTGFANNRISVATQVATFAAGDRFSVIRNAYPWRQFIQAIGDALDETHITGEDYTLIGDGSTEVFTLPAGVFDVKAVSFERPSVPGYRPPSTHWHEERHTGKLWFDHGYPPMAADIIHVYYKKNHSELSVYSDAISNEINLKWLKNKAAEKLLIWAMPIYGRFADFRIEERMNIVMNNLKTKAPRLDIDISSHTAG